MPADVTFTDSVLAIHIAAVMIAFGITFVYPLMFAVAVKQYARALPALHRIGVIVGQRVISPGLGVVLVAGIVLASEEHQWSKFYVGWGVAAVIVLGAVEGAVTLRLERRLAEAAERDVAGSGEGPVNLSVEYQELSRRWALVGGLQSLLVLVTVFFMATHTGA